VLSSAVERGDAAGVAAVAVTRDESVYEGALGQSRAGEGRKLERDSIFRIYSMTKVITSAAVMQLVEREQLSLDLPASEVRSELSEFRVLREDGVLAAPDRPITLRHLLTHTSGLAYPVWSPRLAEYQESLGDAASPDDPEVLVFDPGEEWQYSTATDWAGRMVETVSGQRLDAYVAEHVSGPLGMSDTGFEVPPASEERLSAVYRRPDGGGPLEEQPFEVPAANYSGGAGLVSTALDYARFLRMMLHDGELDGARVLSPASVAALATDQIAGIVAGRGTTAMPVMSNDFDASEGGTAGHGLGGVVSRQPSPGRRAAGTLSWAGLANTFFWIDRAQGVAGALFTQILPFWDARAVDLLREFEAAVYAEVAG
jgi:CubicO group peptidase (beta-lactamase class C family)